ncbi:MAG: peptide ABC transporter substrate-binding protein [Sedimentisphaerales bacterium]|nr:peptide ABC transporter substrate-binding protein [Sedimentisphaerales bacterium]
MKIWHGMILAVMGLAALWLYIGPTMPSAEFNFAQADDVATLDPARVAWMQDLRVATSLWEGLYSYHPKTNEPIEGVAYYPPAVSADGLTYTFTLRPDARWSNGDKVTAEDFVYSWRRAIEPGAAADYAFIIAENVAGAQNYQLWRNEAVRTLSLLEGLADNKDISQEDREFLGGLQLTDKPTPDWETIANAYRENHLHQMEERFSQVSVKALDNYHLQVNLPRIIPYFPDLMSFGTFLPVHRASLELLRAKDPHEKSVRLTMWIYDSHWTKPDYHKNGYPGVITNGAYCLSEWRFKQYLRLEANPYYWDRANVHCQSIKMHIIPEAGTAFLQYERGELDWLNDLTRLHFAPALVEQMNAGIRKDIHVHPAFGTYFYFFNCRERLNDGSPNPLADKRLRQALNLAVDKQALVTQVKRIGTPPARTFIPPGSIVGYKAPDGPGYNPEKACELLAQAGYLQGKGLRELVILYDTQKDHDKTAQAIAEMWRNTLGIKVRLEGKELKTFDEDRDNQNYMIARGSWFGDYMDPTTYLDMMVTGNGNNESGFACREYDDLVHEAAALADAQLRLQRLALAEDMINSDYLPVMPLYYYVNLFAFRENVQGIEPNFRNMHPMKYWKMTKP